MSNKFLGENPLSNSTDSVYFVATRGANGDDILIPEETLMDSMFQKRVVPVLEFEIGDLYIEDSPNKKGIRKFNKGYFEYLLLDGSEYLTSEYPILAKKYLGNVGLQKFRISDMSGGQIQGCTIRHIPSENPRALGSYEEDQVKSHDHEMDHEHEYKDETVSGVVYGGISATAPIATTETVERTTGGRQRTGLTGGVEGTMKNVAVQIYVKAKVIEL